MPKYTLVPCDHNEIISLYCDGTLVAESVDHHNEAANAEVRAALESLVASEELMGIMARHVPVRDTGPVPTPAQLNEMKEPPAGFPLDVTSPGPDQRRSVAESQSTGDDVEATDSSMRRNP